MAFVKRNFLALIVFLCTATTSQSSFAQGFVCDGRFFISLYADQLANNPDSERSTELHKINFGQGQVDFTDNVVFSGIELNGLGYNTKDNLMYGVSTQLTLRGIRNVVRLYPDGTHQVLDLDDGEVQGVQWGFAAASCSSDGYYVVHDRESQLLHYLDVTGDNVSLHASVSLKWTADVAEALGDFHVAMDDFAFDVSDAGTIYSYQRDHDLDPQEAEETRGRLLKIDADLASPTVGTVSLVGEPDRGTVVHIGAMFFDTGGKLYGYGSATPFNPNPPGLTHERLVAIDKETGEIELVGTGPLAQGSDGCSCPFALGMQMQATVVGDCQSRVRYETVISNSSATNIDNVVFTDTLPDRMRIASTTIPDGLSYSVAPGTGVGTAVLTLENLSLPPNTDVTLVIEADVRGVSGTIQHQSYLANLPVALGSVVASDDPSTNQPYDPTAVTITNEVPLASMMTDTVVCEGQSLNLSADVAPGWSFYWSDAGTFYSEETSPSVTPPPGQDSVYYYFHQQLGECAVVDSVLVQVAALPEPTVISDTTITSGTSVSLAPTGAPNSEFSYQWLPSEGLSCRDCANPIASPVATTDYEVTVSNAQGCTQVAQVLVTVEEPIIEPILPRGGVHLPNAFSPNGDGRNDIFAPVANQQVVFHLLEVYNRWGEQVYRSENFSSADRTTGWDGTYRGQRVAAGTYTFRLVATEEDQTKEYRGKLHLLY